MSPAKNLEKTKTVFDHIKHIRESKTPNYYISLNENDQKTFNKYVILMGLSMDINAINNISCISKYIDILPSNAFYKACCELTPTSNKYYKWIKSSKYKFSKKLLEIVSDYYKISKNDAYEYCLSFVKDEVSLTYLISLCMSVGYSESQVEKMLEGTYE